MTARVKNDAEWDLGLSPEACEARSIAIRDDFESFALTAGQAIFAQPVAPEHRKLADWASLQFARNDATAIGVGLGARWSGRTCAPCSTGSSTRP